uniref:Uncharacterized protein n=1 Tax=Amphimedon queenslandica TaxID=400682 RepID=A0A1X7U905_AMPQE
MYNVFKEPSLPLISRYLHYFIKQEIDGETLPMLVNCASLEQLNACGLHTIKKQMKLRKHYSTLCTPETVSCDGTGGTVSASPSATSCDSKKLTLSQMKVLSPEHKRLYLMKRNKVAAAARNTWPGNNVPCFRNNKKEKETLDDLVISLIKECSLPIFGEKAIRQHILDTLTERRRNVKKGYNYEQPPAKKKLKLQI